ncbi:MAG TPA: proline iminopeptidase-family hydrolase [Gemmatimonadales bacterium]|nr:proline iminopeptidase-family hydrolase [Gemmatimonadales bacterium]
MKTPALVTALLVVLTSCEKAPPPPPSTPALPAGEAFLSVPGGRIWYKVSGTGRGAPVILLHGGPGFSSFYLKPMEALGSDRVVVRYDQLGGGKSDHVTDTTMFTIPHFVAELDSLRAHLGYDKVHLMGHSWGTILAVEYYRAHPQHVLSLTLGSAALDIPAWERHARDLLKTLPDSEQRAVRVREAAHQFDSADYQGAIADFYSRYVWRHPVAADLDSTMKTVNEGIYNYMQGPSEFTITGTLKPYNVTGFLKSITVPVLYTVGEFDEANPETIRRFASMTPGARVVVLPGSGHITTWDAPAPTIDAVRAFLRGVDSSRNR